MKTLVLLLAGPMQSWGVRSSFNERDTQSHPTRSALLGMFASACGLTRTDPLPPHWSDLHTVVRCDRPGRPLTDFHTVGGDYPPEQRMITATGKRRAHAMITRRRYLTDAAFTVFVQGQDHLIHGLAHALHDPRWAPYLGRRSCPPSFPVLLGVGGTPAEEAATHLPLYRLRPRKSQAGEVVQVRCIKDAHGPEAKDADRWIADIPGARDPFDRSFTFRAVIEDEKDIDVELCAEELGARAYQRMRQGVADL